MKYLIALIVAAAALASAPAQEIKREDGAAIFKRLCADCHGGKGEGVAGKFDEPLHGERGLEALAKYIDRTMPEDAEEKLDAEGSKIVAAYIFDAFYSQAARDRLSPPRRDFQRLTNRQFLESIADLAGSFVQPLARGEGTGLTGKYYDSDGMNKKARKRHERLDRAVEFDFGDGPPIATAPAGEISAAIEKLGAKAGVQVGEGMKAEQFSIAWQGSLFAPETGWYEFRLKTQNGVRLYLNTDLGDGDRNERDDSDARRVPATIEGWVTTGPDVREETGKVFLLGGRAYPLRLDYFKYKEKAASVRMEWKMPHGVWEVLAAPYLSPAPATRVVVVPVSFPADDNSTGFERGVSVSKEWHDAATKAALHVASDVSARLGRFAGLQNGAADAAEKTKAFLAQFAARAFRRPLTEELRAQYVDAHFAASLPVETSAKRAILAVLQSPRFLYPDLAGKDDFGTASRLALALWDSLPDGVLVEAAAKGELRTLEQVRVQAERMVRDPRARAKMSGFFEQWLSLHEAHGLAKDAKLFPGFDTALVADLRRSLELFVERVMWSEASSWRELLTADYLLLNPRLAKFYGVEAGGEFERVAFDPQQRAGVITHPYLLSAFSYPGTTSPIHRGVFLTRKVLGRTLRPPPQAIEFKDEHFDPGLTMREKVTQLTRKEACAGCHQTINALGFSLESFDATGRVRATDNQKPVDTATDYTTPAGDVVKLRGARDLAEHAAGSADARRAFVRQMFHYLVKATPAAFQPELLARLDSEFANRGTNMRELAVEIAVSVAK